MHLNSELLFRKYALPFFRNDINVLEIGSTGNTSIFKRIVNNPTINWSTLDIGTKWIGNTEDDPLHTTSKFEYNYPFDDETFDIIISGQVMEHVIEIWTWLFELKRITKKTGFIITISPISWDYHATPVDCWRIYPEGMKALMVNQGLKIIINTFESLEKPLISESTPTIPGISSIRMDKTFRKRIYFIIQYNRILHFLPLLKYLKIPITCSYDNICICMK